MSTSSRWIKKLRPCPPGSNSCRWCGRVECGGRLGLPWHYGDADDTTDLFTLFIEQVHARAAQR